MNITLEDQIGEIVANDYRTAAVFKANGIDFCCRGNRSLGDAAHEKGISANIIINELQLSQKMSEAASTDYTKWKLEHVIDHIIEKHHKYVRQQIPVITSYLDQINKAHGKTQPFLADLVELFAEDANDLKLHMETEEGIVFPMIRDLATNPVDVQSSCCVPLNFFQEMITAMELDHTHEGERWRKIGEMTQDYTLQFGCKVAFVAFNLLKEYYEDLILHIHLENNILFPEALELKTRKVLAMKS